MTDKTEWRSQEAFDKEVHFYVGQRVRVAVDYVKQEEIQCDEGLITDIKTSFPRSPEYRQISYGVKFDKPFLKPECVLFQQIYKLYTGADRLTALEEGK